MDKQCPICFKAYGKRQRCYTCQSAAPKTLIICERCGEDFTSPFKRTKCHKCTSKPKTGETRSCKQCRLDFYVQKNVIDNSSRNAGIYCSRDCKYKAMKGQLTHNAKPDEKTLHSAGYLLVWQPDHPKAHNGRVLEHVVVMEEILGRPLELGEHVHHINRVKTDNRPENLQLVNAVEHGKLHKEELIARLSKQKVTLQCKECGSSFDVKPSRSNSEDPNLLRKYCSLSCRHKGWNKTMMDRKRQLGLIS